MTNYLKKRPHEQQVNVENCDSQNGDESQNDDDQNDDDQNDAIQKADDVRNGLQNFTIKISMQIIVFVGKDVEKTVQMERKGKIVVMVETHERYARMH